jgi:hypothetical protein
MNGTETDSLNTLVEFDKALRSECETARIVVRDDGRNLMLVPARGGRLTLAYKPDRISLRFEGSTLQGTSYIACDRDGLKIRAQDHGPMDPAAAAKYIVTRLMKGKMP